MFSEPLLDLARRVLDRCRGHGLTLVTAESCTGGLIAACLTEIAGSSDVVDRAFVTYSNAAKMEMLGVPADLLAAHGAVSEPASRAMAEGALAHARAGIAVAATGIAGPGGASAEKPVGLVHLSVAVRGRITHERHVFPGSRGSIRVASTEAALLLAVGALH